MKHLLPMLGILAAVLVGALVGYAGSQGGVRLANGPPLFAALVAVAFLLQWIAFLPAYIFQTEKFFDLMGGVSYIALVLLTWAATEYDGRSLLLGGLIVVWAVRLAGFLFLRVRKVGHDARFRSIKPHFPTFFMTWTLQGLWVSFTAAAALAAMTATTSVELGMFALVGGLCWLSGFVVEVVADRQKSAFRADSANEGGFITTGLWAWSRHPNYFGEILLWIGIAIIAFPALAGWQFATLASPVFVWLLLTRISGIRMLEARADRRWGDDSDYRRYRDNTPALVPRPPR